MVKVTLKDGTVVEGTSEEIYALDLFVETGVVESVEVAEDDSLKVGDYARVIEQNLSFNRVHPKDAFVEISVVDEDPSLPYEAVGLDGKEPRWFAPEHLAKATDEEVASAKAQAEADAIERKRTAVFTDAGREVNELRKGDIVRVTASCGAGDGIRSGDIIEVTNDSTESSAVVGRHWGVCAEIITFVENRLDRN